MQITGRLLNNENKKNGIRGENLFVPNKRISISAIDVKNRWDDLVIKHTIGNRITHTAKNERDRLRNSDGRYADTFSAKAINSADKILTLPSVIIGERETKNQIIKKMSTRAINLNRFSVVIENLVILSLVTVLRNDKRGCLSRLFEYKRRAGKVWGDARSEAVRFNSDGETNLKIVGLIVQQEKPRIEIDRKNLTSEKDLSEE